MRAVADEALGGACTQQIDRYLQYPSFAAKQHKSVNRSHLRRCRHVTLHTRDVVVHAREAIVQAAVFFELTKLMLFSVLA